MRKGDRTRRREVLQLVVANKRAEMYPVPYLRPAGMKAGVFYRLLKKDLIELPYGSEPFIMPDRPAVGYSPESKGFRVVAHNPFSLKEEPCFAVSAFVSPGYTITYNAAYTQREGLRPLPLFSYAAICLYKGKFYTAAARVDKSLRQDLRLMPESGIREGIKEARRLFPKNRLFRHLERCALCYNCPAAKNLFLKRQEAPLPASPSCNSRCIGCISYQPDNRCSVTQPRIEFVPGPEEISEVALFHIRNVKRPVVSFGQGCEGEPLLAGDVMEKAIRIIRGDTGRGIINLNTNASRPGVLKRLFDAGLDSMRVSINSAQQAYYTKYYRPRGYAFQDVLKSIRTAKKMGRFVSLNYLVLPGFTDSKEEFEQFRKLLGKYGIDMVQLRNLNIDPLYYFRELGVWPDAEDLLGIREVIRRLRKEFPLLRLGYFNPSSP